MSENRCRRCNRRLNDTAAEYGWKCAQILGYRNPKDEPTERVADVQHASHKAIDKLEAHGINWKSGVGEEMLYDMVRDEYGRSLLSLPDPYIDAPGPRTRKPQEPGMPDKPWETDGIELPEEELAAFEHLWSLDLSPEFKQDVWDAYMGIGDDKLNSKEEMHERPTAEILARMLYAEQYYEDRYQHQTANIWALLNRLYAPSGFSAGRDEDGNRKKKNLRNLMLHDDQFSTLTSKTKTVEEMPAYGEMNADDRAWRNAKLLAAYVYAIVGDKSGEELEAEGMTYEKLASILSQLINLDGASLENPFPPGQERWYDSWRGGNPPMDGIDYHPGGGNYFYNYDDYNKKRKKK